MKRTSIFLLAALTTLVAVVAYGYDFDRATTFEEAWKASCRVVTPNAMGTGTFIGFDDEKNACLIFTNYHVVTNNTSVRLDFWTNGYKQSVNGHVVKRFYSQNPLRDFAIIEVGPDELANINPPWVALGGRDAAPDENSIIISSGCPDGRFPQAWKGKVIGDYSGATVLFQPPPVPGQSGSAIISKVGDELFVTGILTWLIGPKGQDSSKGGAIPVSNLWDALESRQNSAVEPNRATKSLIPPDATECSASEPYVLYFSQDNCPPCVQAKKDIAKLKQDGVQVIQYNVTTSEEGQDLARSYKILGTPTFIVCSPDGSEIGRAMGPGKYAQIKEYVASYEPPAPPVIEKPTTNQDSGIKESIDAIASEWFCINGELEEEEDPYAFRNRAPVYENDDAAMDAGFFEDSDARWRNRGRQKDEPRFVPPITEKKEDAPALDENKLGDRLKGKLNETLDRRFSLAISQFEKRFDDKANAYLSLWKKKLVDWYDSVKYVLFFALALFVTFFSVVGNVLAHYVLRFINWYFTEPEVEEEEKDEKSEENVESELKK